MCVFAARRIMRMSRIIRTIKDSPITFTKQAYRLKWWWSVYIFYIKRERERIIDINIWLCVFRSRVRWSKHTHSPREVSCWCCWEFNSTRHAIRKAACNPQYILFNRSGRVHMGMASSRNGYRQGCPLFICSSPWRLCFGVIHFGTGFCAQVAGIAQVCSI